MARTGRIDVRDIAYLKLTIQKNEPDGGDSARVRFSVRVSGTGEFYCRVRADNVNYLCPVSSDSQFTITFNGSVVVTSVSIFKMASPRLVIG